MHLSHVQQAQDSRAHENYGEAHGWIDNSTDDRVELMKVLAMMMRVVDMEEIDVLQETMSNMVLEKRKQEKGLGSQHQDKRHLMSGKSAPTKSKCSSGQLFPGDWRNSRYHDATSNPGSDLHESSQLHSTSSSSGPPQDRCYCGLKLIKYTCRKQGVNYIEAVLPVPERTLEHPAVPLFPMDSGDKGRGAREHRDRSRSQTCQRSP
jgi:hypothetical protein